MLKKIFKYPSKNGEEGKKNCTDDVGTGEREHDVIRLAPGNTHVNEGDEIKESPKTTEGHVENDEMLPSLDGGHLFKKPIVLSKVLVRFDKLRH